VPNRIRVLLRSFPFFRSVGIRLSPLRWYSPSSVPLVCLAACFLRCCCARFSPVSARRASRFAAFSSPNAKMFPTRLPSPSPSLWPAPTPGETARCAWETTTRFRPSSNPRWTRQTYPRGSVGTISSSCRYRGRTTTGATASNAPSLWTVSPASPTRFTLIPSSHPESTPSSGRSMMKRQTPTQPAGSSRST